MWRFNKLQDFQQRARNAGLEASQEYQDLFTCLLEETAALETLWESQKARLMLLSAYR